MIGSAPPARDAERRVNLLVLCGLALLVGIMTGCGAVALRWLIQQDGVVALSRTTDPARIPANFDLSGFELDAEDMWAIGRLAARDSRIVSPTGLSPAWDPTPAIAA